MKHLNCRHIIFFQISYKFLIKVIKQFQKTCNAWRSYHSTIIGNKGCNQEDIEICPHKSLSGSKQLKWHKLKPRAKFNFKLPRLWLGIAKAVGGEGHLSMDTVLIRDLISSYGVPVISEHVWLATHSKGSSIREAHFTDFNSWKCLSTEGNQEEKRQNPFFFPKILDWCLPIVTILQCWRWVLASINHSCSEFTRHLQICREVFTQLKILRLTERNQLNMSRFSNSVTITVTLTKIAGNLMGKKKQQYSKTLFSEQILVMLHKNNYYRVSV